MKVTSEQLLDLFGLKVGDIVRVSLELGTTDFIVIKYENGWYKLRSKVNGSEFRDNITFLLDKDYEIIKPTPKLSEDEKVELNLAKLNGCDWVFRNKNGGIFAKYQKPFKANISDCWCTFSETTTIELDYDKFKFITWEDEEPYNIKELLDE